MKRVRWTFWLLLVAAAGWCLGQATPPAPAPAADVPDGPPPAVQPAGTDAPTSQPDRPTFRLRGRLSHSRGPIVLSDQQREQVRQFLQTEQPELFAALEKVRDKDPANYTAMLDRAARPTLPLIEMKRGNPELYGLYKEEMQAGRKVVELAQAVRKVGDEAQRSELLRQLRDELDHRFDVAQSRQRLQVKQFRQQVERLEAKLQARQANKEKIIAQQLQLLLSGQSADGHRSFHGPPRPGAVARVDGENSAAPTGPTPSTQPE